MESEKPAWTDANVVSAREAFCNCKAFVSGWSNYEDARLVASLKNAKLLAQVNELERTYIAYMQALEPFQPKRSEVSGTYWVKGVPFAREQAGRARANMYFNGATVVVFVAVVAAFIYNKFFQIKQVPYVDGAISGRRCNVGFVDNDNGDPEDIAVSMLEMKFFHNHTEYASILDDLWEDARRERDYIDEYEYDNYHHIDPHELSSSAKAEAMKQWADTHDLDDIHKRTRDAESLASLRSTLKDAESGLSARVDAVSVMWDKIREWPHAIPG
eukprot:gene8454-biopygen3802